VSAAVSGAVTAYIGLGANLGDSAAAVAQAIAAIAVLDGVLLTRTSALYASTPVDAAGDNYVNAVVQVQTRLGARQLLRSLQTIEQGAGRLRPYRNAPRTLDLDLLLFGAESMDTPELQLPHPRMWSRAFVLEPLAEIAPDLVTDEQRHAVSAQGVWKLPVAPAGAHP